MPPARLEVPHVAPDGCRKKHKTTDHSLIDNSFVIVSKRQKKILDRPKKFDVFSVRNTGYQYVAFFGFDCYFHFFC